MLTTHNPSIAKVGNKVYELKSGVLIKNNMKKNFSKNLQSILKLAKEEAIRLGHSYVGSEHLAHWIIKN